MKKLQDTLKQLKTEAVVFLIDGNISAHLAKLIQVADVQVQIAQLSVAA